MSKNENLLQDYVQLEEKLKVISHLRGISGILEWDEQVMMPSGAADARANQSKALQGVIHDKATDPALGDLLARLKAYDAKDFEATLNEWQRANVRDADRNYKRETRIPKELAEQIAGLNSKGYHTWAKARETDDYDSFAPVLQEWIDLRKKIAKLIDPDRPAYDICIDEFERNTTADELSAVFEKLRDPLAQLINEIKAAKPIDDSFVKKGKFDTTIQAKFCEKIALDIGFDKERGRLDVSLHPFTGGACPTDVRMTTRFKEHDLTEGLTGAIHETGHSLYEQGRNKEYDSLPVSEAMSMGIHESQSLFWERMIGLNRSFFKCYWEEMKKTFNIDPSKTVEDAYRAHNTVTPGLIRVESDEVTYPMHIIIRFEIERDIFNGTLEVKDIPRVWNEKMKKYLGVDVPSNKVGVLQDIHWAAGAFGYFPTYSLGAINAAQIFAKVKEDMPDVEDKIARGEFEPIRKWLNEKIHVYGSLHGSGSKLMEVVTGRSSDPEAYLNYLRTKYSEIYNLA